MKRRLFKTILLVVLAVFSFSLSSCEQLNFTEKLDLIAPDADYGFSIYNNRYLVIDGAHYELENLAYDVVKEKDGSQEVYGATVCGGNMYYLYQYSAKKDNGSASSATVSDGSSSGNRYRFGVALLKTNLENAETKLIYDFKNVYPHHNERATPHVMQAIDKDTFAFIYNGKISVFNVQTEEITQTIDFYDKEAFVAEDNDVKLKVNKFNDFYYVSGGTLSYAEYKSESKEYVKHDFAADEKSFYVDRFGNYVYTYGFIGASEGNAYYDCYDLATEEAKDRVFLTELIKKREEQEKDITERERLEQEIRLREERSKITVGGKVYRVQERSDGELEIINEAGETVFTIDEEYATKNNEKITQLIGVFFNCENGLHADFRFKVFDNRLFVIFSRNAFLLRLPNFIFELDPAANDLKYVTYIYGDFEFYKLAAK